MEKAVKWFEVTLISICAVFAPIKAGLLTALVLIIADTITGVMAAHKRKEPITSAGLRRSISKLIVYELAILLGYLAEHYLMSDYLPATKIISGMVGAVELKSVLENLDALGGGGLLRTIIDKLGSDNQPKG